MIVREMSDGQLLCIHQTSHALMAEEFCRCWGNADFATPTPYSPTMLAISQHDNGWYEWELNPKLRPDGYPMDFMHDTDLLAKLALWRRSIDRAYAQHPYAAILIGRHATLLYQSDIESIMDEEKKAHIAEFIADQQVLLELVRYQQREHHRLLATLQDDVVESNTRLLQVGDQASLQVSVPWGHQSTLTHCPLDGQGEFVSIQMYFDEQTITFDPWPYRVSQFDVSIQGCLLARRTFASEEEYRMALNEAPFYQHTWRVVRAA
jgi:hypothetical protein